MGSTATGLAATDRGLLKLALMCDDCRLCTCVYVQNCWAAESLLACSMRAKECQDNCSHASQRAHAHRIDAPCISFVHQQHSACKLCLTLAC